MPDIPQINITELYKDQISLTEWFEKIKHPLAAKLRAEDSVKRDRLEILHRVLGINYDKSFEFPAAVVSSRPPEFIEFLKKHGDELCALRLSSANPSLPKLRIRGLTISASLNWFKSQHIDYSQYKAEFVPHSNQKNWSTIFVVNSKGIFGEIIKGDHYQLTQGFYENSHPINFTYNFRSWRLSDPNPEALSELKSITSCIHVVSLQKRRLLKQELSAEFSHNYLLGYFETVSTPDHGLWFLDYNRLLGNIYHNYSSIFQSQKSASVVSGRTGHPGKVTGIVRIIPMENIETADLINGEVLVCSMTTPKFVPLMQKAAAIITDQGGVLSHAAIISRELNKPCIVGTINATQVLKTGDLIEIDASAGIVKLLNS